MSGRWDQPGVPHKNWSCVAVEDLGEPTHTCEMCGNENIRHVHAMAHPSQAGELLVGCVCAEKMETNSLVSPKRREGKLKSRAKSRAKWLARAWRTSASGNGFLRHQGVVFLVASKGDRWRASWKLAGADDWQNVPGTYANEAEAKLAAFDARYPPRITVSEMT